MYRIRLEGIRFRGKHGALPAERHLLRDFTVDLEVTFPASVLPKRDDMKDVMNYDEIASLVVEEGTRVTYKLLETLAKRVIERILENSPAQEVTVRVSKYHPPTLASVERVIVELTKAR